MVKLRTKAHSDPDADSNTIFDTSESTEVNNVASRNPTSSSNVDKKKKGCVDDREETDSVSAVSGEGETTKSRPNTIDWFEYRGTPQ